jgi:hypothetical protein
MKLVTDPRPSLLEEIADFAGRWGLDLTGDVPEQLHAQLLRRQETPPSGH